MKRIILATLLVAFVLGCYASAFAATEVKMTGDVRVFGEYNSFRNWTGLNQSGTAKEVKFGVWERFRLRTDFIANEALKFRFGVRINNVAWGSAGTGSGASATGFEMDNPASNLQVYQAFLQFKWPDSDVQISAGLMPLSLPQTSFFNNSVVLQSDSVCALVIDTPLMGDTISILGGYARLMDLYPKYQGYNDNNSASGTPYMHNVNSAIDAFFLALPIKLDGFKIIPWGTVAIAGRETVVNPSFNYLAPVSATNPGAALGTLPNLSGVWNSQYGNSGGTSPTSILAANLISPGTILRPYSTSTATINKVANTPVWYRYGMKNPSGLYGWAGLAFEMNYFDPIKFYCDVIWGGSNWGRKADNRSGFFLDGAVEYTGLDMVTPQLSAYWSSGEDSKAGNGSERMPSVITGGSWGPSNSFLYQGDQQLSPWGAMNVNPIGSWGLTFSLNKISFIEGLTHRLTFSFANGTNSPSAIKQANAVLIPTLGSGVLYEMGRDLTTKEWVYGVAFDHKYMIYENLAAIVETGWAHGNFQKGVWGNANNGYGDSLQKLSTHSDAWKIAFGLQYKF